MTEPTSVLDAAFRYADRGWHVFPCKPNKKPYTAHGFLDASTSHDTIVAWWREWPDAHIGIACGASGICVIDLDVSKTKNGLARWGVLCDEHGQHGCGLIASTPRGGHHYVYLQPDPPVGCSTDIGQTNSGIDVRGDGGYIVAPSPASPGRAWITGDPFEVNDDGTTDLSPMPKWVTELARAGRKIAPSTAPKVAGEDAAAVPLLPEQVASIKAALQHIDSDPRDTWIRVGMALKSTGAKEQAFELWCEWSQSSPKFDPATQRYQWDSLREFFRDGHEVTIATLFHLAKDAGHFAPLDESLFQTFAVPADPVSAPSPVAKSRPFDRGLVNVPGLVGDVAKWLIDSSTRQQPALCLASAIATMGAVLGRRVATPTDLRTNVYLLGIGETACGKDPSVRYPQMLLERTKVRKGVAERVDWATGPGEWKSDSGLRAALIAAKSHCAYCDEFTKTLAQMAGAQAPAHLRGIKRYLLELYGAANSVHLAAAYADRLINKPVTIQQPNLCLYGTGVPSELFTSLDRGALADGFLNRFLIFWSDDQAPPRQRVARAEPPEWLVEKLARLAASTFGGEFDNDSDDAIPIPKVIDYTDDAQQFVDDFERENDDRLLTMRADGDRRALADLWVRFGAHVQKLALIRVASDDPDRCVEREDLAWAHDLVVWSLERTMLEAANRVADSPYESACKRILRTIVDAGADGLRQSELTRATQWARGAERKDMLSTLIESGQVTVEQMKVEREGRGPVTLNVFRAATLQASADGSQHFNSADGRNASVTNTCATLQHFNASNEPKNR